MNIELMSRVHRHILRRFSLLLIVVFNIRGRTQEQKNGSTRICADSECCVPTKSTLSRKQSPETGLLKKTRDHIRRDLSKDKVTL